ncbi:hypothetical protein [Rhizobium halophytocola]|uniref:Uncharacterized protein n=1 Tax=Rhizobium halophytocola TaxID=735519 RepID=A0ABS4DU24_9HYPH|nr:hypothetical protein [Rhizobium halophytocola]MBP1849198.1 hypothetical protein [Rhizobium halophytocola]
MSTRRFAAVASMLTGFPLFLSALLVPNSPMVEGVVRILHRAAAPITLLI